MKKLLLFGLLLFISFVMLAHNPNSDDNIKPIEFIKETTQNPPRNIFISPIECYLYNRTLHFNFYENLGNTTIIVSGVNNNEVRNVDSTDSFLEINMFNFNNGIYSIEIIAENGDVYIGEFQL